MYGDKQICIGEILVQISADMDLHLLYEIKILKKVGYIVTTKREGNSNEQAIEFYANSYFHKPE